METTETGSIDFLSQLMSKSTEKPKEKRNVEKCSKNLELFCKTYFPEIFKAEFCDFHRDVFRTIERAVLEEPNRKHYIARTAPRGHGKSQIISFATPIWLTLYGYRKNILIISDTGGQVEQYVVDIKEQFEENEKIKRDFGNLATQQKIWRQKEIVLDNGVHIVGKSAGQSLRGIKYHSQRPDFIIIDDLENDENVETDDQRQKLYRWFTKALMKCGCPNSIFVYIGTILNYDALLYKVMNSIKFSMWNRKLYKAVYEFSQSPLWDEWERILSNAELGNEAPRKAEEFYLAHEQEMLEGVKCLWSQKSKHYYYDLMLEKFNDEEAFNSELQNDPLTDDMRVFKNEWLMNDLYTTLPEIKAVYSAVDVSMGKNKKSDTSAIIDVGVGVDNYLYVLEADVKRKRSPDVLIEDMIEHIIKYYDKLKAFTVETDVFLEFVAKTMQKRVLERGLYVNWHEVKQQQNGSKDLRIKSLVPKVKHGYLRFHPSQKALLKQLRNYPKDNDDAPDCLQMALSGMPDMATGGFYYASLNKPKPFFDEKVFSPANITKFL